MRDYDLLELLRLLNLASGFLRLEGEDLVAGETLLLEVPLPGIHGLFDLRNLREPPRRKRLQPAVEEQSIIYRVGVPLFLIEQIDLPVIDIDEPRTEEVVALKIDALDGIAANQRLEVIIDQGGDSLETADIVYQEDLEQFLQDGGDQVFLAGPAAL